MKVVLEVLCNFGIVVLIGSLAVVLEELWSHVLNLKALGFCSTQDLGLKWLRVALSLRASSLRDLKV